MRKSSIKNIIHLLLILLPTLLLLIACIFPTKKINNTYALEETTTTETETTIDFNQLVLVNDTTHLFINDANNQLLFNQDTNLTTYYISGFSYVPIIENHKYLIRSYSNYTSDNNFRFASNGILSYYMLFNNTYIITATDSNTTNINIYVNKPIPEGTYIIMNIFDLSQMGLEDITQTAFNNLFPLNNYTYTLSKEYTINELTITNNIGNQAEQPLQSEQTREPNYKFIEPLENLYNLQVNNWYHDVLQLIGIESNNRITNYLLCYPLWLMWFFLLELIEMIITAVPRIIIKISESIGGKQV